jgi:prepilin-type processing-associated H-X9-DG protein
MGTAAGFPSNERLDYDNNGKEMASLGNHGWTLDPPKLTEASDRGTGDAGSKRTAVDPRHRAKANVIFCDGHGETKTADALGYRILEDGAFVDLETVDRPPTNRLFAGTGGDEDPPKLPR